jgi:acetyl-CoA acyltransferase 1
MGIGPSIAIPRILTKVGISLADVDVVELNEAFASMAVYCQQNLGIERDKMNVRGGAIALGHPLGCTGTRQIVTGLSECRRGGGRVLLTSMCVGTGQGMAAVFVSEA